MNRRYSVEEFENGTNLLRKAFPNVALTTDVIVGFPGETDKEFNTTYEFLKKIKFYKTHIFKYSRREGTRASVMPNQIDGNIKEERSRKLIELSDRVEKEYNERNVGKVLQVLFEEPHLENNKKYMKGHTTNYITVKVELNSENQKQNLENTIQNVKIIKTDGTDLIGIII